MPPRKRARHSVATGRESTTPVPESPVKSETPNYLPARYAEYTDALSSAQHDPWTDEEETLLFKSLVRWKPTGIHKHFRMLSIFEEFRSHGHVSGSPGPPPHLRIPGIWAKLYTLYDLDALDQRENAHAGYGGNTSSSEEDEDERDKDDDEDGGDEVTDDDSSSTTTRDFALPDSDVADPMDFGDLMWRRRILDRPDEQFSGPELVKGLSRTRTIPGAKLGGADAGASSVNGDDTSQDEADDGDEDDAEEEEREEDGDEEDEDDEGGEDAETADEDDNDEKASEEEGSGDEIAESASTARTAATATKRGRPRTRGKPPPPRRRGTRRR